jgi:type VII secretion protein EccB
VSRKSLATTPRGPALGILGAPDSLPDQKNIVSKPWTICSEEKAADQGTTPEVDLLVGRTDIGATNVGNRALVVASGDGGLWYIGNGTRHETDQTSLRSLGLPDSPNTTVGLAWLNAVPGGEALKPLVIPNRGKAGLAVDQAPTVVGQIFKAQTLNGDPVFYVMQIDGLAQLTQTQAQLILGSSAANQQPSNSDQPTEVPLNAVNEASQSPRKIEPQGLPRTIPEPVDLTSGAGATVCAWFDDAGKALRITVNGEVPDPAEGSESNAGVGTGLTADHVHVVSGQAAVVAAHTTGSPPSAYYLVTDAGVKFPVPDEATLGKLGYSGVKPLEVPSGILGLVPQGPALNAEDAARPAPVVPPAAAPAK